MDEKHSLYDSHKSFEEDALNCLQGVFSLARIIGVVTIGQSPRTDIIPEMRRILGSEIKILEIGALDGLTIEEVKKLAPKSKSSTLVSRMKDGTEVKLDKNLIIDRMQDCICSLTFKGVDLIVILCTGDFPEFHSDKLLIEPSKILYNVVAALMKKGKLGLIVPSPDQILKIIERWIQTGLEVFVESASPYSNIDDIENAAKKLKSNGVDLIIMDCIGYNEEMTEKTRKLTGRPTICPYSLAMRIVRELLA